MLELNIEEILSVMHDIISLVNISFFFQQQEIHDILIDGIAFGRFYIAFSAGTQ